MIIALPINVQPDFIKQALSAGKHVLAEKPLAPTVADGRALIDWYRSNVDTTKVFFGIAEQFRYLNAFLYGAEKARELGKVIGFRHRLSGESAMSSNSFSKYAKWSQVTFNPGRSTSRPSGERNQRTKAASYWTAASTLSPGCD